MANRDPYRPDPYLPAGPDGPLLLPNPVARMLWPAVRAWLDEHHRMGALDKLRAAGPTINRWDELVLHAEGFSRETPRGEHVSGGRPLPHDDWISTEEAADEIGCTPQWVNTLARRGDLESQTVGRTRVISRRSAHEHRQRVEAA